MTLATLVRGGVAVLEGVGQLECDLGLADGKIAAILAPGADFEADAVIDATGLHVLPGIIDPHAHFGLGNQDDWRTESRAAAYGGVTSVLNYIQSTRSYLDVVPEEVALAGSQSIVDFGIHPIIMNEQQLSEVPELVNELGIWSFKYFANFKGNEGAYMGVDGTDTGFFYALCRAVAKHPQAVLAVHPENIETVWRIAAEVKATGRDELSAWTDSRPDFVEAHDMGTAFLFAEQTGCRIYIPHLSAGIGLELYRRFRSFGGKATIETCPHYLTQTSTSPLGSLAKVNPPLRTESDGELLWEAIRDGTITVVGSDHNSRPRSKKEGSIWSASAGFPGVSTLLPVMLSEGYHRRGIPLETIVEVLSRNAARVFGIYPAKGTIAVGSDADLTLVDLERDHILDHSKTGSASDYSLWDGWRVRGWPVGTIVRGTTVMSDGEILAAEGHGEFVGRARAGHASVTVS